MKRFLGKIKRGSIGIFQSVFEKIPKIPKGLKPSVIGKSVQGRNIIAYKIGNGPTPLLFCANIHGNEIGTSKLARHLIDWLFLNTPHYTLFTFFIIPCLNPDGRAQALKHPNFLGDGRLGRFNANNVDLNRNFPTNSFQAHSTWGFGKDFSEKQTVFCGSAPGSEPENKTLRTFIEMHAIKFLMMFHSAGGVIMGTPDTAAQNLAAAFAQASGYKKESIQEWEHFQQTGTAREWCAEQGIIYLEPESRYRWGADWQRHKAGINAVLDRLMIKKDE